MRLKSTTKSHSLPSSSVLVTRRQEVPRLEPESQARLGMLTSFFDGMYMALHYSPSFNKFKGDSSNNAGSQGAVFIRQEVVEKRDSFDSLSDMTSVKESIYESETGSNPSSPFNTLTKTSIAGLKPPGTPSSESTLTTSTVVETTRRHQISFPASVTPSGSFLDLSASKEGLGNDNKV